MLVQMQFKSRHSTVHAHFISDIILTYSVEYMILIILVQIAIIIQNG